MQMTATPIQMNPLRFSLLIEMIKTLLDAGKISRKEADATAQRIASEYELSPIYLW